MEEKSKIFLKEIIKKYEEKLLDADIKNTKIEHDTKYLILICKKMLLDDKLNNQELKFLYERDYKIELKDKKSSQNKNRIRKLRNIKEDLKSIYNYSDDDIADNVNIYINNPNRYKCLISNLMLESGQKFIFPNHLVGNLVIEELSKDIIIPKIIDGNLVIKGLSNPNNLKLPEYIFGNLEFTDLNVIDNILFPKYIGGDLILNHVANLYNFELPNKLGGNVHLNLIHRNDELCIPDEFNYKIYLNDCVITPSNVNEYKKVKTK